MKNTSTTTVLWKQKKIRVPGAILGLLLLAALALQAVLHLGWTAHTELDQVTAIAADGDGRVWVTGYRGSVSVLMLYQENARPVQFPLPQELTRLSAGALMVDGQGRVWMGTDDGFVGMREFNGEWILYTSSLEYSVWGLVMDEQGQVWVRGHRGPGLIDPGAGDKNFTFTNSGLPDSDAAAIATDGSGRLWALTQKREVMRLASDGSWSTYAAAPVTVRNAIFGAAIAVDEQGQIWLASDRGVGVLGEGGAWTAYPLGDPARPLSITAILPGPGGRVWVGSQVQGLFMLDPERGWTNYTSRNSGLSSNSVTALARDPQGQIWIGTSNGRLNKWNPGAASLAPILPALSLATEVILPAAILSVGLLAVLQLASGRWGPISGREIGGFSIAFAGWFILNSLLWVWVRASHEQSGGLLFINPLGFLPLLLNVLALPLLYLANRWMALGVLSAFTVNWIVMILSVPLVSGSGASAILMIPFFLPFFLALRSSSDGYRNLPG